MKELFIIITAVLILTMIVCSEKSHLKEKQDLEWESAYWKGLFLELLKKYRKLKNETENNRDKYRK